MMAPRIFPSQPLIDQGHYCLLWTYFTPFSSAYFANYKQVNVSWVFKAVLRSFNFIHTPDSEFPSNWVVFYNPLIPYPKIGSYVGNTFSSVIRWSYGRPSKLRNITKNRLLLISQYKKFLETLFISVARDLIFFFRVCRKLLDPHPMKGPIKSPFSVCPSVGLSINSLPPSSSIRL